MRDWLYGILLILATAVVSILVNYPPQAEAANGDAATPRYPVSVIYNQTQEDTVALYRSALTAADNSDHSGSTTTASTAAVTTFTVGRYQTLEVSGRHSVASATVLVKVLRYNLNSAGNLVFQSKSEGTLTADNGDTDGSKYTSPALFFDTGNAEVIKVVIDAPSSGNVDLWVRSY